MSSATTYANLPENVKELVSATKIGESHSDQSEAEKKEVDSWIAKASDASFASQSTIPSLNADLTSRTYLVGNNLTTADIAVYGVLHPIVSKLSPSEYYSTPALTRYFDHIQNNAAVRANASAPPVVPFDLDNAPKQERKAEEPVKKKKEKKEEGAVAETTEGEPPSKGKKLKEKVVEKVGAVKEAIKGKKEKVKKEPNAAAGTSSGKGESSKAAAAAGEGSGEPTPSMIDLRVGKIVDIKVHPDADGLYVEQLDLGEEGGPRTVISGLVHYIPIENMRERYVVAVCNLKPANMRGIKSHAMILCATSKTGKEGGIEVVQPPEGSAIGDRIFFEGYEADEPVSQLNPKKKIFETIQPGFTVLDSTEAAWVDPATKSVHRIQTKNGVCKAPTHIGGTLS